MKKHVSLVLIIVLVLSCLVGCAGKSVPAAKVGDEEITVSQLQNYMSNWLSTYSAYASLFGYDLTTDEGIESLQDDLLDGLLTQSVLVYQAKQAGLTLTSEEAAEAKKTGEESYDSFVQSYVDYAKSSGAADPKAYANKMIASALADNGTTVGKYKKELQKDAEDSILAEKMTEKINGEADVSPEALKALFDQDLEAQKAEIEADPSAYFNYGEDYGTKVLYTPEGLFEVRHILIAIDDDGEEAAAAKAADLKARLDNGADFDAMVEEMDSDPGMADGAKYVVGEGAPFVEEFLNAALALEKEGDISEPVMSSYGYHIIRRYGNVAAGAVSYEDDQEGFDSYYKDAAVSAHYDEVMEGWLKSDIVVKYPENYRSIGK